MISATGWADTLMDLLERQQAIYAQLHAFSRRQSQLIEAGDSEGLLALLDERQGPIDQLLRLSREIEPFRQQWQTLWGSLDETKRRQLKTHMDAAQGMLDHILQQDERDRAALAAHRQNISTQLTSLNRSSSLHRAYGSAGSRSIDSRFTDQRG